jgi:HTH-type transcriptional regulator / antitoxin HigA
MELRPIRTERDHRAALAEIERLWQAAPGTAEHDRLEVLGLLVNAYEEESWPVASGDAVDAIRFRMEQVGYTQADLATLLGSRSRASEILKRRRALTIEMAAKLSRDWRIPAESLLTRIKRAAAAGSHPPASRRAQAKRRKKAKSPSTG